MSVETVILVTAVVTGLYMAWNIGANDVANAMGTSVGSGALTLKRAIVVAGIFEFAGAMLVGGQVTETVRKGIVDFGDMGGDMTMVMAVGMMGCLLAAAIWLHLATYFGWPVSTTHSIVGAVVGFGLVAAGPDAVNWETMGKIVSSWVLSPAAGGILAFGVFTAFRKTILDAKLPAFALKKWGPALLFPVGTVLALSLFFKGLKPLRLDLSDEAKLLGSLAVGFVFAIAAIPALGFLSQTDESPDAQRAGVRRVMTAMQIMTACFVAFAHGSNDVANAVGPLAAVIGALDGGLESAVRVPAWVMLVGALGIVVGLATYGHKVMATIGEKITELSPSHGFSAEFAAAATIVVASNIGMPVSTTHTLVGSVIGVGFAQGKGEVDGSVVKKIVASWFITVPFAGLLSALIFVILRAALL